VAARARIAANASAAGTAAAQSGTERAWGALPSASVMRLGIKTNGSASISSTSRAITEVRILRVRLRRMKATPSIGL
jgi:hypothetical protein